MGRRRRRVAAAGLERHGEERPAVRRGRVAAAAVEEARVEEDALARLERADGQLPAVAEAREAVRVGERVEVRAVRAGPDRRRPVPVCKSNLQPEFNARVIERFGPDSSVVLRELDESNRFVQKSAESTSI